MVKKIAIVLMLTFIPLTTSSCICVTDGVAPVCI